MEKIKRNSFHTSYCHGKYPTELIHTDVCGPIDIALLSGHRYYLLMVDDMIQKTEIKFLKQKNEAHNTAKTIILE